MAPTSPDAAHRGPRHRHVGAGTRVAPPLAPGPCPPCPRRRLAGLLYSVLHTLADPSSSRRVASAYARYLSPLGRINELSRYHCRHLSAAQLSSGAPPLYKEPSGLATIFIQKPKRVSQQSRASSSSVLICSVVFSWEAFSLIMEDERNTQLHHQGGEAQEKAADQVEVKDRGILDTLLGRKKPEDQEKKQEEELVTGMEKVTVAEPEKHEHKKEEHEAGEKKESLLAKLHRTSSSSSSSSDEEEEVIDENGEIVKRKKKKGLKEKIKEKLPGHKDHAEGEHHTAVPAPAPAPVETHAYKEDDHKPYVPAPAPPPVETHVHHHDHAVVVQKIEDDAKTDAPPAPEEEKKGLLDKIKEKLPGGHKKPEDAAGAPAVHAPAPTPHTEDVSSPDGKEKKGLLGKIMDKIPGYNKGSGEEDHKAAGAAAGEHKTTSS